MKALHAVPWLFVALAFGQTTRDRPDRAESLPLAARCLFEDPAFDIERVPLGEWSRVLEHHSRCHGWRVERLDVFPEIPFVAPASCPDAALARLWRFVDVSDGVDEWERHVLVALALNGRAEEALDAARRGLEVVIAQESDCVEWSRLDTTACSQVGARIALVARRFDEALTFTETWFPTSWCGTCSMGEMMERERVRALALDGAGRLTDERSGARGSAMWQSTWYPLQWLEAATRELSPEAARVRAAKLAKRRFAGFDAYPILEAFELLLAPAERVTPREVELLSSGAPAALRQRWAAASAAERQAVCAALFPADAPPRPGNGGWFLLGLGTPELEPFVDRTWSPKESESSVTNRRARYDRARAIWAVFAGETSPAEALRR